MDTIDEANQAACWLWESLKDVEPMMAPHEFLQWDATNLLLLEFVNSKALLVLQEKKALDWIYLVSPGMAIVQANPQVQGITELDDFVQKVKDYNTSLGRKKARDGGYYIERVVISKTLMEMESIRSNMKEPTSKVYMERMEARDPKSYVNSSKTAEPSNSSEVVVTLNNFHYTKDQNMMKSLLENHVTPYLVGLLKTKGIIPTSFSDDCLTWVPTQTMITWRLITPTQEVSNYLCTHVVEKAVVFQDMQGHMQFRSKFHMLAKTDVQQYFANKMILDVSDEPGGPSSSVPESGPQASGFSQWERPATPRGFQPPQAPTAHEVPQGVPPSEPQEMPQQPTGVPGPQAAAEASCASSGVHVDAWEDGATCSTWGLIQSPRSSNQG